MSSHRLAARRFVDEDDVSLRDIEGAPSDGARNRRTDAPFSPASKQGLFEGQSWLRISLFVLMLLLLFLHLIFTIGVVFRGKCNMSVHLEKLLDSMNSAFKQHGITYFLDFGTALGVYRDGGILPFDFDIDIGMMHSDCQKLMDVRNLIFEEYGLTTYSQDDYIAEKAQWGYSPYISEPCGRIYDQDLYYYVDVYGYSLTDLEEDDPVPSVFPEEFGEEGCKRVMCHDGDSDDRCLCYEKVFPLKEVDLHGIHTTYANDPTSMFVYRYGSDWETPHAKGYKSIYCDIDGSGPSIFTLLLLTSIVVALVYWTLPAKWKRAQSAYANGYSLVKST